MAFNIIFAGSSDFAVPTLEKLLHYKTHRVIAIYTAPDRPAGRGLQLKSSPIKTLALQHNIPVYQPGNFREEKNQQLFKSLAADLMVVVAYGLLLPKSILESLPLGCLNIHPSLLPRWRGAAPIPRSIQAGDVKTGVTIMQLDEGLDTGPIWLQTPYSIQPQDTSQHLSEKLAVLGAEQLLTVLDIIIRRQQTATPQATDIAATYAAKIEKSEAPLDWTQPAVELALKIRAFNPWPVASTLWEGKTLRIWAAYAAVDDYSQLSPGTVVVANSNSIEVATGKGSLQILRLQLPGGKPLPVSAFMQGYGRTIVPKLTRFHS